MQEKPDKQAFLIFGPEASGNRMMARVLISAGCQGDGGHFQRWETERLVDGPIVWLRSVPSGSVWPDIRMQIDDVRQQGYQPLSLIMVRDWNATMCSQVRAGHLRDTHQAATNMRTANFHIFSAMESSACRFEIVSYDAIIARGWDVLGPLITRLGLEPPPEDQRFEIYDGNAKYY
jgi:hypothetical protein